MLGTCEHDRLHAVPLGLLDRLGEVVIAWTKKTSAASLRA